MARRTPESLADYLAVAVCPALIMLLVGSLVFFLIEVFYQGQYEGRLVFVMAMFVMAIVCIARISIEQDVGYASLFALPLAGVVLLAMSRFVTIEGPLASVGLIVNMSFMGIVWWSAHKLTWDCTLIDDSQDASGQGLLQEMGLDSSGGNAGAIAPGMSARPDELEAVTSRASEPERPWWERWLASDKRPHAPGVWVVYFSLAALPLFGFGGWFVPSGDAAARGRVFQLLLVYVGSGLALLLATSFLGLRRYLRQRRLAMPLEMTATWLALGLALIAGTLVAAAILPRPRAEYSLTQLPIAFTSAVRRASQFATGKEGTEDETKNRAGTNEVQEGQQSEQQGNKGGGKSGEAQEQSESGKAAADGEKGEAGGSQGKSKAGESQQSEKGDGDNRPGESKDSYKKSKGEASDKSQESQGKGESSQPESRDEQPENRSGERSSELAKSDSQPTTNDSQSPPSQSLSQLTSNVLQGIGNVVRWLAYGILLAAGVVLAWIYRAELAAAWHKLLAELRELWAGSFGSKAVAAEVTAIPPPAPPRPFAAFADPFASGAARHMAWPELVRYSFEAAEAWGREHETPRHAGQTPHEFALALGQVEPQLQAPLQSLAAWYSQLAYAQRGRETGSVESLKQLWRALRMTAAPPVALPDSA